MRSRAAPPARREDGRFPAGRLARRLTLTGTMTTLIALLVVAAIAWRAMSKEEKRRALRAVDAGLQTAVQTARERGREERASFRAALRTRTPSVWLTPVLMAVSVAAFLLRVSKTGAASDAAALI